MPQIIDLTDVQAEALIQKINDETNAGGNKKTEVASVFNYLRKKAANNAGFGIPRVATTLNSPPNNPTETKHDVFEAGTYTNWLDENGDPIEVTEGDLDGNFVWFFVKDAVVEKKNNSNVGSEQFCKHGENRLCGNCN